MLMIRSPASEDFDAGLVPKRGSRTMVRGDGCWLWDSDDRRYLDLTSAHGIAPLGHSHPDLTRAITDQAAKLIACSQSFRNDARAAFLEALDQATPTTFVHAFLCNSGAEAIEAGLKFAFLTTGKETAVALKRDFHGRTLGALGVTWNPRFRKPFEPLLGRTSFVEPGDLTALETAFSKGVGLFVVEVIQGESGVHPIDPKFLLEAQELCRRNGVLFMVDEIQTGVGRTGSFWAHQSLGLDPDLMAVAKGIAGGFPMGALLSSKAVAAALRPGLHGSTFGGGPLASSAGLATLEVMRRDNLAAEAAASGTALMDKLRQRLQGADLVKEIRGRGLMIGIELRKRVAPFLSKLMEEHSVLALPAGPTVLRLLPALVIDRQQIDEAADAITAVLAAP